MMLSLRDVSVLMSCLMLLFVQPNHGAEIIDGAEVKAHSMPFMALLENEKICGGILIHPKWVLTAAHCENFKKVTLGVHSIKEKEKEKGSRQIRTVKTSIPHPCYDKTENVNDLRLLKLDKPVKETKTVKHLALPKSSKDPKAKSSCVVAGWGKTKNNAKEGSDVLRSVNVTVIDRATCNSQDYYNLKPFITSGMICAGSNGTNNADSCQGDSGGPLLCNGVLTGVTSFGKKCGLIKKPGVYAYLSDKQLSWIKKTMK